MMAGLEKIERERPIVLREMRIPGVGGEVLEVAFSADGAHLISASKNFAVRIWGTRSGEVELLAPPLVSLFSPRAALHVPFLCAFRLRLQSPSPRQGRN